MDYSVCRCLLAPFRKHERINPLSKGGQHDHLQDRKHLNLSNSGVYFITCEFLGRRFVKIDLPTSPGGEISFNLAARLLLVAAYDSTPIVCGTLYRKW
jgi:hypothetical protein